MTGGRISDLIASGEPIRGKPSLTDDHGQSKGQELQLIRVFGTDRSGEDLDKGRLGHAGEGVARFVPLTSTVRGVMMTCMELDRAKNRCRRLNVVCKEDGSTLPSAVPIMRCFRLPRWLWNRLDSDGPRGVIPVCRQPLQPNSFIAVNGIQPSCGIISRPDLRYGKWRITGVPESVKKSLSAWYGEPARLSRRWKRFSMGTSHPHPDIRRVLLEATLTELAVYAKDLCPGAEVETSTVQYEDEDGHLDVFPPVTVLEAEEEQIELTLAERAAEIFADTGLYILCAVLDPTAR